MYRGEGYKHLFYFIKATYVSVPGSVNHWPRNEPALRARLYDFISRFISSNRSLWLYTLFYIYDVCTEQCFQYLYYFALNFFDISFIVLVHVWWWFYDNTTGMGWRCDPNLLLFGSWLGRFGQHGQLQQISL